MSDRENLVAALSLEFSANRRYGYQIERSPFVRLNTILEGVRRTEGDHVEALVDHLKKELRAANPDAGRGFATMLAHLKLDLAFEREAVTAYGRFAREAEDPAVRDTFKALALSEAGHIKLFRELVAQIEENRFPAVVYCPICGWELDYGVAPADAARQVCPRCKQAIELTIEDGDFVARSV